jgi:glycosyltransferase involved in cell wall biosynthesis
MTDVPLISVVVPVFNSARFLAATLESVVAQSEQRWECVIVDDGSTDSSASVAASFAAADERFRVISQTNRGASAARNCGFRASNPQSRYVTFMDSDDVWRPRALQMLRERLDASPDATGAHGLADFIDAEGRICDEGEYAQRGRRRWGVEGRRLIQWPLDRPTDFSVLIIGNVLFPPGLLLARRAAYDMAGPFDESFSGAEDWDMLIRLSRHGSLEFLDQVILYYRRHDQNLGARVTIPRQAWLVLCKAFHSPENSPEQRRVAKMGWRAYQRQMVGASWALMWRAGKQHDLAAAARELGRIVVFGARYARGWPSPRLIAPPLEW